MKSVSSLVNIYNAQSDIYKSYYKNFTFRDVFASESVIKKAIQSNDGKKYVSSFVNTSLAECDVHKTSYNNLMKGISFLLKALLKSLAKVIMLRNL